MELRSTIFAYYDNESSGSTEFHRLARNIRYRGNPTEIKSILVTSAVKDEGKSLITANLAIAMAKRESSKKIVMLDFDLRRSTMHSLFRVGRAPGLSDLLAGEVELEDAIRETELDNLKLIPSGRLAGSPSQLLNNVRDVLDTCKERFDIVICDSPPIVPVDDVAMIGPCVDGVLLVVMAGKVDRAVVKRGMDIIKDTKARVLGIALNNMHGTLPYYYDYGYYKYRYEREGAPESGK